MGLLQRLQSMYLVVSHSWLERNKYSFCFYTVIELCFSDCDEHDNNFLCNTVYIALLHIT